MQRYRDACSPSEGTWDSRQARMTKAMARIDKRRGQSRCWAESAVLTDREIWGRAALAQLPNRAGRARR